MEMTVTFPGNLRVEAHYKGFDIGTDQPEFAGGDNSAPAPFDLFLASIGTCAGFYAMRFLEQRGYDSRKAMVILRTEKNDATRMIETIHIDVRLPKEVPEKYYQAIIRSVDQCAVKKLIIKAPDFRVNVVRIEDAEALDSFVEKRS
ncbi:OsmC family protein [bacterium]|nr:OsmC family protein [candidate division CSSED10-310 bacterium]